LLHADGGGKSARYRRRHATLRRRLAGAEGDGCGAGATGARNWKGRQAAIAFRIYVPVTKGGADIYVHAKLMIVDDRILRIGSANLNNRSLGLDSECDMVLDCALPANRASVGIAALRTRLLAEHLDVS
jgi:phosphatidylserine/phosphatidylglycerophosphate/cardiolipin synthase-like enzyme